MIDDDRALTASPDGHLAAGGRLLEQGDLGGAAVQFEAVRAARPERWEGHLGLAQVGFLRGDLGGAFRHATDAVRADARCVPAYQLMAQIGWQGGVADVAIAWLEHGAQAMPTEAVLFEWLVRLYALDGRLDDLGGCLFHYAELRERSLLETALMFARDPSMPEDVRARIVSVARG